MSVIGTVSTPASDFVLGETLTATLDVKVQLERVLTVEEGFVPYVWASEEDVTHMEAASHHEDDIESFEVVDTTDGEALLRVEVEEGTDGFLDAVAAAGGTILDGVGRDVWWFQLRFEDHDGLTAFYRRCADHGVSLDIEDVHNPGTPRGFGVEFELTEAQLETLRRAFEAGHFEVPRESNLADLAAEMGVSDTAISERLRRGIATLLSMTLEDSERPARETRR